jgi:hypothetical protein
MGYVRHHAIAFTSYDEAKIKKLHEIAMSLAESQVTPLMKSNINSYYTFFLAPDGSKEWWPDSDHGDEVREKLIAETDDYISFCEFYYGDDEGMSLVTRHN